MFFQQLSQIMNAGLDYNLTVSLKDEKMTVLVSLKANGLKDPGQHHLIPFVMTAPPAEVDRLFFPTLQQPLKTASGVITNMVEFEKQTQKAASQSKPKKEEAAKEDKATKEKREKYDKHMKKSAEQLTAKDYSGALTSLQQARLHAPGDKETKAVDEKISQVKKLSGEVSLFDVEPNEVAAGGTAQPGQAKSPVETARPNPAAQPPQMPPQMPPQGQQINPGAAQQGGYPGAQQGFFTPAGEHVQYPMGGPQSFGGNSPQGFPQNWGQPAYPQQGGYQQPPFPQNGHQPYNEFPYHPGMMQSGEVAYRPEDYAGIPDIESTHVGEVINNQ